MPKLVIFDGVDNAGKTWLINELYKEYPKLGRCKFPSAKLANKPIFHEVTVNPTRENRHQWLAQLMEDIYTTLLKIPNEIILVDRMWYSTLIYQGDGVDGKFLFEEYINNAYAKLMEKLKIAPTDVYHILFGYPLCAQPKAESDMIRAQVSISASGMITTGFFAPP